LIEKIIKEKIVEREESMNKGIKYILGFAAIFVAAVICVFGIIKYEEMQEGTSMNNSANLGSVDGKQLDKETTIIIEKLSTLNDIDALNSELHLSQAVIDILKKYAPTISYAVDNSEGYDVIYFRLGGYYADFKINDVNKIIGSYKVDGGKLTPTGDDLDKIGNKVNGNDKLKWTDLNLKNTDHNKSAAKEILKKYNLDEDKFVSVNAGGADGQSIFSAKEAEAIFTFYYTALYMESKGLGKVIDSTLDKPEVGTQSLAVGRTKFLEENPDVAVAIIKALERAKDFAKENPEEAGKLAKEKLGMDAEVIKKSIPKMGLNFVHAQDAKKTLNEYYKIMKDYDPKNIGGKVPDEHLYINK